MPEQDLEMNNAVIDAATFAELQDAAGAEFVSELVATFLEEAPGMLADLRSARAASDAERFRRAAHSLKSNCNTFGALALGAMAREIEFRGLQADAALDAQALAALDAAYADVAAALKGLGNG
jgi:HPt (histidine-containing phosphotransfer) domain-containing protein